MKIRVAGNLALIGIFSWLAVGCASSDSPVRSDPGRHKPAVGPISPIIEGFRTSRFRDECDDRVEAKRAEIAQALDARAAEIEEAAKRLRPSEGYRIVDLGGFSVRERIAASAVDSAWREDHYGWSGIIESYDLIKSHPVDANWVVLNSWVRGIIPNDQDRLKGYNVYLDKDSGPKIEEALTLFGRCNLPEDCEISRLTGPTAEFLRTNRGFSRLFATVTGTGEQSEKIQALSELRHELSNGSWYYRFSPYAAAKRRATGELEVPIDLGDFAGLGDALAQIIESRWKLDSFQVKIRWAGSSADLFRLFRMEGAGGRSYVSYRENQVALYPLVRANSIAHEIGHVIGFPDNYFTSWVPSRCEYRDQFRDDDLMSNPESGTVLPIHWQTIGANIPVG